MAPLVPVGEPLDWLRKITIFHPVKESSASSLEGGRIEERNQEGGGECPKPRLSWHMKQDRMNGLLCITSVLDVSTGLQYTCLQACIVESKHYST